MNISKVITQAQQALMRVGEHDLAAELTTIEDHIHSLTRQVADLQAQKEEQDGSNTRDV